MSVCHNCFCLAYLDEFNCFVYHCQRFFESYIPTRQSSCPLHVECRHRQWDPTDWTISCILSKKSIKKANTIFVYSLMTAFRKDLFFNRNLLSVVGLGNKNFIIWRAVAVADLRWHKPRSSAVIDNSFIIIFSTVSLSSLSSLSWIPRRISVISIKYWITCGSLGRAKTKQMHEIPIYYVIGIV